MTNSDRRTIKPDISEVGVTQGPVPLVVDEEGNKRFAVPIGESKQKVTAILATQQQQFKGDPLAKPRPRNNQLLVQQHQHANAQMVFVPSKQTPV